MPIHDWECELCHYKWEELVKMDEVPEFCPKDVSDIQMYSEDQAVVKHNLDDTHDYKIKKLPSKFGKHLSWSSWNIK